MICMKLKQLMYFYTGKRDGGPVQVHVDYVLALSQSPNLALLR